MSDELGDAEFNKSDLKKQSQWRSAKVRFKFTRAYVIQRQSRQISQKFQSV